MPMATRDMTERTSRRSDAYSDTCVLFDEGGKEQQYFRTDTIRVQNIHSRELEEDIAKLFVVSPLNRIEHAMNGTFQKARSVRVAGATAIFVPS
jgi:hypothetical protein